MHLVTLARWLTEVRAHSSSLFFTSKGSHVTSVLRRCDPSSEDKDISSHQSPQHRNGTLATILPLLTYSSSECTNTWPLCEPAYIVVLRLLARIFNKEQSYIKNPQPDPRPTIASGSPRRAQRSQRPQDTLTAHGTHTLPNLPAIR